MIDPIENVNRILQKPETRRAPPSRVDAGEGKVPAPFEVQLTSDSAVKTVRQQAADLRNDLPRLISAAVIAPVADQAAREAPLNSLLQRLTDPLRLIMNAVPKDQLSGQVLTGLQEELSRFREDLLAFRSNPLLTPLLQDPARNDVFGTLMTGITGELDGVISQIQNKA